MLKTLNTYLIDKAKLLQKDERHINSYISTVRGRYCEHNFELDPKTLLSSLTESFPTGDPSAHYEMGKRIATAVQLFSELEVESEIIESDICGFVQEKLIPDVCESNNALSINNLESIVWGLGGIGTEQSLSLIETILSDAYHKSFSNYPFLISACLYAYKTITDKNLFKFFKNNYSRLQNSPMHREEVLIEKIEYFSRNKNNARDIAMADYYSYLLEVKNKSKNNI